MKLIKNKMCWPGTPGLITDGPSETLQGDTLPLKNILLRYANGIDIPRGSAVYGEVNDDEHESEDLGKALDWDLVDKEEATRNHRELLDYVEKKRKDKTEKIIEDKKMVENGPEAP